MVAMVRPAHHRAEKLLLIARSLIDTPYKYAAKPKDIPQYLDCSSFTQYVYKQLGIDIPRSTILQAAKAGTEIPNEANLLTKLKTGDLLFFRGSKGHYDESCRHRGTRHERRRHRELPDGATYQRRAGCRR